MKHVQLKYKPHIDGLRAIAVTGVVLYHFGATWIPGGFLGVDVFFVISGFLIARSIYREVDEGGFSLVDFYERRARRILPALLTVTAVTTILAYWFLFPRLLVNFTKSVLAALTFTSNIYFWLKTDYFAPDTSQIPLLHYWSLGVEEQFYIFFPLLALAISRLSGRAALTGLCTMALASLLASQLMLTVAPEASFYLLPFRAFELLIGCILARPEIRFPSGVMASATIALGIALIAAGMILISERNAFPGAIALVPCLGAALVIWGAEQCPNRIAGFLGNPLFRFLGAISYSLYLVHWPIYVFLLPLTKPAMTGAEFLVFGTSTSIFLGWLSYRYVEQPFRRDAVFWTRKRIFSGAAVCSIVLATVSTAAIMQRGFPSRISDEAAAVLEWRNYDITSRYRLGQCFLDSDHSETNFDANSCIPIGTGSVTLWGDSVAAHYYTGLSELLATKGFRIGQATSSGCPPVLDFPVTSRPSCQALNRLFADELVKRSPEIIVLAANWSTYPGVEKQLSSTIRTLSAKGTKVLILGQTPLYQAPVPEILASRLMRGDRSTNSDNDLDFARLVDVDRAIREAVPENPNIRFHSILEQSCPSHSCPLTEGGIPLMFDRVHFTEVGSRYFSGALVEAISNQ